MFVYWWLAVRIFYALSLVTKLLSIFLKSKLERKTVNSGNVVKELVDVNCPNQNGKFFNFGVVLN